MWFISFIQHIYTKKCSKNTFTGMRNVLSDANLSSATCINNLQTMTLFQGQVLHMLAVL